jgi:cytochrome c-type biogenesis protein
VAVVGAAFATHRDIVIGAGALLIVALGVFQMFGGGFDLGRLIPWRSAASGAPGDRPILVSTFLLGTVSGAAGFCAGPILGAVLGLAAADGQPARAGLMLAVYAAGMVVPLVVIAAVWDRWGIRLRSRMWTRQVRMAGREVHLISFLTGLLLVVVGVAFWTTNGFAAMPELIPADQLSGLQTGIMQFGASISDVALVIGIAVLVLAVWGVWMWRQSRQTEETEGEPAVDAATAASDNQRDE